MLVLVKYACNLQKLGDVDFVRNRQSLGGWHFYGTHQLPQIGFVQEAVAALKVIGSDYGNGGPIIATPEKCHLFSKFLPHELGAQSMDQMTFFSCWGKPTEKHAICRTTSYASRPTWEFICSAKSSSGAFNLNSSLFHAVLIMVNLRYLGKQNAGWLC